MRRSFVALALLCACLLTMGAGWLSGPRFGPMVCPGFAPVQQVAISEVPETPWETVWSSLATECIRAYNADNIVQGGVGSYDVILDSSPYGANGSQINESLKVTVSTDSNGKYWTGGNQKMFGADRPALATYTLTAVIKPKRNSNYSLYCNLESAYPWSAPVRHAFGAGLESTWGRGWLGNADFALGPSTSYSTATWQVISTTFCPSASASIYLNGSIIASFTGTGVGPGFAAAASATLNIGGNRPDTGGAADHNDIRVIMIYEPLGDRRERIEAALMEKYL